MYGIELEDGDGEAAGLEKPADAGRGDALPQRGGDPSGHKDILRHRLELLRGFFQFYGCAGHTANRDPRGEREAAELPRRGLAEQAQLDQAPDPYCRSMCPVFAPQVRVKCQHPALGTSTTVE